MSFVMLICNKGMPKMSKALPYSLYGDRLKAIDIAAYRHSLEPIQTAVMRYVGVGVASSRRGWRRRGWGLNRVGVVGVGVVSSRIDCTQVY